MLKFKLNTNRQTFNNRFATNENLRFLSRTNPIQTRSKKLPSKQKLHSAYTTTTYNRTSLAKRVP